METRTCKVCGVEKPFERGTWVWKSRDGLCVLRATENLSKGNKWLP